MAGHSFYVEAGGHTFVTHQLLYWAGPRTVSLIKHIRFWPNMPKYCQTQQLLMFFWDFLLPFLVLAVDCIFVTVIEN